MEQEEPVQLEEYRTPGEDFLNMTLRALSCAPRVFEISNFLSTVEVEHILEIADATTLGESTLGDEKSTSRKVRTSRNSWVARHKSPVVDAIYRRAADLMRIDEALMRHRSPEEVPIVPEDRPYTDKSIAEELQLVHYSPGQEYQTHHDFAFSPLSDPTDSARFATLLLYLNDDLEGGETSFPKFLNAHTFLELKVKPEIGKAVLFYSQLPDGNMDEFSQHKAHVVRQNYKWLINLWVWDPVRMD
jgi:prolyl 4-hydroxylase